jgi:hypothetical protein
MDDNDTWIVSSLLEAIRELLAAILGGNFWREVQHSDGIATA